MIVVLVLCGILVSVVLVFFILIQNPKGGGLSSGFSSPNNILGVQRTGDILERGTWILCISIMTLAILVNIYSANNIDMVKTDSKIQEKINKTTLPSSIRNSTLDNQTNND